MLRGPSIFAVSLFAALAFKLLELFAGIENGFHPDSLYYAENHTLYTMSGFLSFSTFNHLYYYIVEWFEANVTMLIFLNQVVFALTNVIICRQFKYDFSTATFIKIFLLLLPYRLHLSAHVLKDGLILLAVLTTFCLPPAKAILFSIVTAALRNVAGPTILLVRFFPERRIYFLVFVAILMLAVAISPTLFQLLSDRGDADMAGRDYFSVPLENAVSFSTILVKSIFWPFMAKTGGFAAFAGNPFVLVLALEPLTFLVWATINRQLITYLTTSGALVLILFSVLVTSYGAYHRYVYAFVVLDFLRIILATAARRPSTRPQQRKVRSPGNQSRQLS